MGFGGILAMGCFRETCVINIICIYSHPKYKFPTNFLE